MILLWAYLIGSFSPAYILIKIFKKEDIRNYGSKNAGFTNVLRNYGIKLGLTTLIIDVLKGVFVIYLCNKYYPNYIFSAMLFTIIGHVFPFYMNFRGGKGIATFFGCCGFIAPHLTIISLVIFIIVVITTKYVSLGSMISILVNSVLLIIFSKLGIIDSLMLIFSLSLAIFKHKGNIIRLINGTENKITLRRRK